jgi:hypothetical protein
MTFSIRFLCWFIFTAEFCGYFTMLKTLNDPAFLQMVLSAGQHFNTLPKYLYNIALISPQIFQGKMKYCG